LQGRAHWQNSRIVSRIVNLRSWRIFSRIVSLLLQDLFITAAVPITNATTKRPINAQNYLTNGTCQKKSPALSNPWRTECSGAARRRA
jgi:hypothetical protein